MIAGGFAALRSGAMPPRESRARRDECEERAKRINSVVGKLSRSLEKQGTGGDGRQAALRAEHELILARQDSIAVALTERVGGEGPPERFLREYEQARKAQTHVKAVKSVGSEAAKEAESWLTRLSTAPVDRLRTILHNE